jgi:uncharacterized membrane protein YkoI
MFKRHAKLLGIMVVVAAGLALCIGAAVNKQTAEQERNLSIDQVPTVVRTTIQAQGGTIEEIEMETENGQTVYEAEVTIDGQKVEIKVAADGSQISKKLDDEDNDEEGDDEDEEQVSIDQVPDPVKATILNEAQGGTIKEIERGNENGQIIYEADVIINGQEVELKIAPDSGNLISKEVDDEDEDD